MLRVFRPVLAARGAVLAPQRAAGAVPMRGNSSHENQLHDPVEHVTGIEKRELLAHMAGDCDPFRMLSIRRGPGTRERPNLIPSANNKRLVACSCRPEDCHLEFMWLHLGVPRRCGCGYWFELCPVSAL